MEPLDYMFMFCSANVPGIKHKLNFGNFCPALLKRRFESSTRSWDQALGVTLKYVFLNKSDTVRVALKVHPILRGSIAAFKGQIGPKIGKFAEKIARKIGSKNRSKCM